MISSLIRFILLVLEIAFMVYWLVPIFYQPFKSHAVWALLDRIFAPVLAFLRGLIGKHLPARYMLFDWSYLAVMLVLWLLRLIF